MTAAAIGLIRRTECPLDRQMMEDVLAGGLGARVHWLAVGDGRGQTYAQRGSTTDDEQDSMRASAPVLLKGSPVAFVQGRATAGAGAALERSLRIVAQWLADAWAAALEIESLAGEIVHSYEELHLLYELGERLTSQLTVPEAADVILEKLLETLHA